MIIDEFREEWIRETCNNMNDLSVLLSSKSSYDKDFINISNALLKTNVNPYSFMPKGWEDYKYNASNASSFFFMLCHAMTDDGEISLFFNKEIDSFKLVFRYPELSLENDNEKSYHVEGDYLENFIYWLSDKALNERELKRKNLFKKNQKWIEENCEL